MLPEFAYLGNTLLLLLMASVQFGWLEDLFDEDEEASPPAPVILPEDSFIDPLFDPDLYTNVTEGGPDADVITAPEDAVDEAYFLAGGDDVLDATEGADYAQGGSGDDRLLMREGADLALGGTGNDALFGGPGEDRLFGGPGNDQIEGSRDDDALFGNDGDDVLAGGRDDDVISGGNGNDLLSGDLFDGTGGIERGVDMLDGGAGDDTLWLFGGDTGTGGTGADMFRVMDANDGETSVTITDFDRSTDMIELVYAAQEATPAPVLSVATIEETQDATISLDGTVVATLTGAAGLAAEDVTLTAA